MNYLLSGSIAYDTILLHKGHFHARILPESLARLNVAFGIDEADTEFGGTAGNISYNASLLDDKLLLCSSVGQDFSKYKEHLELNGINTGYVTVQENNTAHAWILTDQSNNQITGFQKGAMGVLPKLPEQALEMKLWHLAPDSAETTATLAKQAIEKKIPYFLDPGQCLPSFLEGSAEHILPFSTMIEGAVGLFVNEYESTLLQEKLGKPLTELLHQKMLFIVETLGATGLCLYTKTGSIHIPVAHAEKIVDPTGCGDALRAGFLYGYSRGWGLKSCAELGSVMGSLAIESYGGQNHKPSFKDISNRLKKSYGWSL
jgi:adenosine kinase